MLFLTKKKSNLSQAYKKAARSRSLTFEKMISNSQFVVAHRFLNKRAKLQASELVRLTHICVFKFALELEQDKFIVLGAVLHSDGNRLN